jgi:hypothetical protein
MTSIASGKRSGGSINNVPPLGAGVAANAECNASIHPPSWSASEAGGGAGGGREWVTNFGREATNFVRAQVANFERLGGRFSKAEASEIGGREGHGF